MKLYDYWRSTAAYRVRLALAYKSIAYQKIEVHLVQDGGQQHSDHYKHINASELVPTLELDTGTCISQSLAIIQYLEDHTPEKPLIPKGENKYRAYEVATLIGCDIHPLNNLRVLQYLQGPMQLDDHYKTIWYHHWIETGFSALEKKLHQWAQHQWKQGPFSLGKTPTIADLFLIAQVYNAKRFDISLEAFPIIASIDQHCETLEWVQAAYPRNQDLDSGPKDAATRPSQSTHRPSGPRAD